MHMNYLSNLPDLKATVAFEPEASLTLGALNGTTLILNSEGELCEIEELASQYGSEIQTISLDDHGRLKTTTSYGFRIGEWVTQLLKITLDNGHVIEATKNQQFLTPSGDWITAENLSFGSVLATAVYNPSTRYPAKTVNEIVHVHIKPQQQKIPAYSFNVFKHTNLLIAHELPNNTISLVPAHIGIPK